MKNLFLGQLVIVNLILFFATPAFAQEQTFQLSIEKEDMPYIQHYHNHSLGLEIYKISSDRKIEDVINFHFYVPVGDITSVYFNRNDDKIEIEEHKIEGKKDEIEDLWI